MPSPLLFPTALLGQSQFVSIGARLDLLVEEMSFVLAMVFLAAVSVWAGYMFVHAVIIHIRQRYTLWINDILN